MRSLVTEIETIFSGCKTFNNFIFGSGKEANEQFEVDYKSNLFKNIAYPCVVVFRNIDKSSVLPQYEYGFDLKFVVIQRKDKTMSSNEIEQHIFDKTVWPIVREIEKQLRQSLSIVMPYRAKEEIEYKSIYDINGTSSGIEVTIKGLKLSK